MRIRVLGAAAGGGFPQWNCGCPHCDEVRRGSARTKARTQDSLAVSVDGEKWLLVNASPDVLAQICATPALHPRAPRHSPIAAIVLTNGDLDHVLGLFSLRESQPLVIFATEAVQRGLVEKNALMRTLARFDGQVTWRALAIGEEVLALPGLAMTPITAAGKLPVHLTGIAERSPEDNVGLVLRDVASGARAAYVGAAGAVGDLPGHVAGVGALFFDGTFWSRDELVRMGLGHAHAEDMAHLPIGGESGSLAALARVDARRKIFTHVNNTNPILLDDSRERGEVERAGWEVAFDGMEIEL